jgi:hypothetical protein
MNTKTLCNLVRAALPVFGLLAMPGPPPLSSQAAGTGDPPLLLTSRVPIPGVAGRIDHFTSGAKRRLLIFSGLGNNTIEMVNTFEGKLVRIPGMKEPQGPLYVAEVDKLFVANAGNREVNVYDCNTYALRKTIDVGDDPDNVRWDAGAERVFVGIVGGIAMIDPVTEEHVGDLKGSGGHSESFQLEKKGSRIFVNVPGDGSSQRH